MWTQLQAIPTPVMWVSNQPPAAPVATAATSVTDHSFTANWNSATGATSYRLDVATDMAFTSLVSGYNDLNVGNVTSRAVSGLTPGQTYYYRVRAVNSAGTSANSNRIAVTDVPAAPVATAASGVGTAGFQANWNSSSGATSYRLDVSTNSGFSSFVAGYNDLNVGNVTSYAVAGLSPGATYYYRLRAVDAGGTSGNSNTISVTDIPAAPVATAASSVTDSGFDANWNSSSGATSYRLDVSTNSGFSSFVAGYNDLNVGNVTSYAVTGLSPSATYYYRLRAVDAGGTSGNSNTITMTTSPVNPKFPATVATIGSWWKADSLSLADGTPVGNTGTEWTDSSGNGHTLTQATSTKRPLFKTGIFNGFPAIRFDGIDDFLDIASPSTVGAPNTIMYLLTMLGNDRFLFSGSAAGIDYWFKLNWFGASGLQTSAYTISGNYSTSSSLATARLITSRSSAGSAPWR